MGMATILNEMIEAKLLSLHTAYLARVISTNGSTAKIQPLGNVKAFGESAKAQSPLSNVPIVASARYKLTVEEPKDEPTPLAEATAVIEPLKSGDIVICVCCERDISAAKKGTNSTPVANSRHSMSNSVIVGIL